MWLTDDWRAAYVLRACVENVGEAAMRARLKKAAGALAAAEEEVAEEELRQANQRGQEVFLATLRSLPMEGRDKVFTALVEQTTREDPRRAIIEAWEASLPEPVGDSQPRDNEAANAAAADQGGDGPTT